MGPALNIAAATGAYVLADRGTWLAFKNRGDLTILVEGDKRLFNQYGVIVVRSRTASARESRAGAAVCRLDHLARGAVGDRRIQD